MLPVNGSLKCKFELFMLAMYTNICNIEWLAALHMLSMEQNSTNISPMQEPKSLFQYQQELFLHARKI